MPAKGGHFEMIFSRDIGHNVGGVAEARLDPPGDYFFDLRPSRLTLDLYRR